MYAHIRQHHTTREIGRDTPQYFIYCKAAVTESTSMWDATVDLIATCYTSDIAYLTILVPVSTYIQHFVWGSKTSRFTSLKYNTSLLS